MKIIEIFDADDDSPSTKLNTLTNNNDNASSRSRCSSRIRRRNGTMLGRHGSANSTLKCYEKDCCSSDEKTLKNRKKRRSSNSIKRSIQKGKKQKMDLADLDDDNASNETNYTYLTVSVNSAKSITVNNNNAKTKKLRNGRSNAMGEGTCKGTKNELADFLAVIPMEDENESWLINYFAHLIEFKWNDPQNMDLIDKNFPNFRAANPELTIKLFVLIFLNICADIRGNKKKEEEFKKLIEIGKKVKELLAEIGENTEAPKFRKLSCEIERTLSLIFSNSIEELDNNSIRQNRRQLAEAVKNALKVV